MSNIIDHLPLTDFGLDFDQAPRYISKGDSRYNLNVLKGEDSYFGELTNLKGNRKVVYPLGDSNAYFVAWSCYDPLTRNVYFYIFSQPFDVSGSGDYEYDNRFVRFNEDSEEIVTLFYDTKNYFGVDPNIRVKDSFVIGDWLFYNPQTSEPKIIDLTRIYNYTTYAAYDTTLTYTYGQKVTYFGGLFLADEAVAVGEDPVSYSSKWTRIGDSYQFGTDIEFDSEFRYAFNQIKHIPVYRPICAYATDPDKNANNVRGKLFRFSHRYKYFDNSYSRYGAYSTITLPQNDESYNGEIVEDLDNFNCIDVSVKLHSAALVKEIDIIFQETGGDWKRAKIINRQDITLLDKTTYTYRFYNTDSAFDQIDDDHFLEPYDDLPRMANSMEIINKNILAFGGVTEGFDNIAKNDIDVILTPEMQDLTIPNKYEVLRRNLLVNEVTQGRDPITGFWDTTIDVCTWETEPPSTVQVGDVFMIKLNEVEAIYELQAGDVVSRATLVAAIDAFMLTTYPTAGFTISGFTLTTVGDESTAPLHITTCAFYASGAVQTALTKFTGFKTGAWHPFCIFYYDEAMRRWDAQTSKDHTDGVAPYSADGTTVYIPMFGEYSPNDGLLTHKWNINWSVNHLPPTGAKWWRWGYAGNALCSQFVQYIVSAIADHATNPWTGFNITPLQTLKNPSDTSWNRFPQSTIEPYQWQKGDRVRVITQAASPADIGAVIDGVYDFEIIAYDDTTVEGEYWIYVQDFDFAAIGAGIETLVEIYTPIKTDVARDFYEYGELMPIIRDSDNVLVHGCGATGTQNQDTTTGDPVLGVFTAGDVYHILRTPSKPIDTVEGYFHESQWYSDFYHSDDWDKGRPGVETQFGERYLNIVRHSKQYLQNTLINGLSTFWGDTDYKELNDVFGDILRIIENGDTLKVYQRKKPSSILIGRTEYYDAEGNANIQATSDRVLGSIRYSTTNYGTEFPESITRNNRYVYGFDIYNGVMWRDSANGIFPISGKYESADGGNYKMETYFKQKAKDLLVSGINGVDVETVWDERHKNLYVIFKDLVTEENNEAIMFHEPSNRWICFTNMDQTPVDGWTQMIELEWSVLRGFDGGIGYEFDLDTRFATFNVVTPHDETALLFKQDLAITLYDPTIIVDCTVDADTILIAGSLINPEILRPFVDVTPNGLSWLGNELYSQYVTVTCDPSTCVITDIPTWLRVINISGDPLSTGATISSGASIGIYPLSANTGGARSGYVTFYNYTTLCSDSVTVSQGAAVANPTVRVQLAGGDNALTSVMDNGSTCIAGSTSVSGLFTPDNSEFTWGQTYNVFLTVEIKDSQYGTIMGTGSGEVFGCSDEAINAFSITNLSMVVPSGYWVYVNVFAYRTGSTEPINGTASVGLNAITNTLQEPTVIISEVSPTTVAESWTSAQFGVANARTFQIDARDAVQTRVTSAPLWLTIVDSGGNDLKSGHYIISLENCAMYPTDENLGGALNGTVSITNEYGDVNTITVQHQAKPAVVPITLSISSNDTTDLAFKTGSYRYATLTDGTALIDLVVTFDSPLYGEGQYNKVYWYATKNGNFAGRSWYDSTALNSYDETQLTAQLVLDAIAEDTDTIVIYFAGNYI